jgi:hypothetical protein
MKALILLFLSVALIGCGKDEKGEADIPTCVEDVGPQQIMYSDGVYRKSVVTTCTYKSGRVCVYAHWVNDPSVTFLECSGG